MRKRFTPKIPKKPLFKRQSYNIPFSYARAYESFGVTDPDGDPITINIISIKFRACNHATEFYEMLFFFFFVRIRLNKGKAC